MENIFGTIDCSGLYTTVKDLSHTYKSVAQISTNNFLHSFSKALKTLPTSVEASKSLVKIFALLQSNL